MISVNHKRCSLIKQSCHAIPSLQKWCLCKSRTYTQTMLNSLTESIIGLISFYDGSRLKQKTWTINCIQAQESRKSVQHSTHKGNWMISKKIAIKIKRLVQQPTHVSNKCETSHLSHQRIVGQINILKSVH